MSRSAEGKRARSLDKHTVHCCVAVVGLPSHELSTGDDGEEVNGIGKSCLCSRFVLPSHDDYAAAEENHSSAVSESEFRDREINSDHYLYFGTVLKLVDTRSVVFHVVEHTTFTDPATRGVHEAGESYAQRATAPSLRSSNKVSYIGGRFRGVARQAREKFPNRFDRRRGPSGGVNGYVLVLDVTVSTEQVKSQINLLSCMADRLAERGNKPYVIALSKCDMCEREKIEATVSMLKEEENFANASIFETSARSGVGVEEAFSHLHRSICRLSSRRSMVGDNDCDVPSESSSHSFNEPFQDSANAVSAARLQAYEGVVTLMSSTVQDATLTWPGYLERIGQSEAFAALISLCGISFCCRLFKSRLVEVKAASITSNEDAESEYSNAEPLSAESQLNAFFSKHSDFAQDMPLDIQSYLQQPSLEKWSSTGEMSTALNEHHVEYCFKNAVVDVLGPTWYSTPGATYTPDLPADTPENRETKLSVSSAGEGNNENVTLDGTDSVNNPSGGSEAEPPESSATDCYYVVGQTYQDGVQQSRSLFRKLTQTPSDSLDTSLDAYIDLVAPNIEYIEEASENSEEECDGSRPTAIYLTGATPDLPPRGPSPSPDKSKSKTATLRLGFSTLKTAIRDQASKTTTKLSKIKNKRAGLSQGGLRKHSKDKSAEGKKSTSSIGSDSAASKNVAPFVKVTSADSLSKENVAGGLDEDMLYEVGDDQELYECVADISSALSVSSLEQSLSVSEQDQARHASGSLSSEACEGDIYSSVEPDNPLLSPQEHQHRSYSLSVSDSHEAGVRRQSSRSPVSPHSRVPPVPAPDPPDSFQTTGGLMITRFVQSSSPCPPPLPPGLPPALPARNSRSSSMSAPPSGMNSSPPKRPPPPSHSLTSPPVLAAGEDDEFLYEISTEANQPNNRVEQEKEIEEVYEAMESSPLHEPVNEYVLEYPVKPLKDLSITTNSGAKNPITNSGKSTTQEVFEPDDVYDDVVPLSSNSKNSALSGVQSQANGQVLDDNLYELSEEHPAPVLSGTSQVQQQQQYEGEDECIYEDAEESSVIPAPSLPPRNSDPIPSSAPPPLPAYPSESPPPPLPPSTPPPLPGEYGVVSSDNHSSAQLPTPGDLYEVPSENTGGEKPAVKRKPPARPKQPAPEDLRRLSFGSRDRETSTEEAQSQGLASVAEDTYEVPSDGAQVVKDTNAAPASKGNAAKPPRPPKSWTRSLPLADLSSQPSVDVETIKSTQDQDLSQPITTQPSITETESQEKLPNVAAKSRGRFSGLKGAIGKKVATAAKGKKAS